MLCPSCRVELKLADRQGIEIDYCPRCRGVWLDRGELDKVVERSTAIGRPTGSARYEPEQTPFDDRRPYDYDDDDGYERRSGEYRKRRRGWLGDLFDFD
ncbi:MAG: zf-TFIIB domain-containing protein [Chloroflexi bacterium]|nr:zf-TFIIB domain-containing protein [Chloroflexota bacterium]